MRYKCSFLWCESIFVPRFVLCIFSFSFIIYCIFSVMPPKRKARGRTRLSPSKRVRGATSTHDDSEIALSTATLEQLRLLSASSLRSHLKAHALPSTGNKAAMVNRLYSYFHTSGVTPSTHSGNSTNPAAPSNSAQLETEDK